MYGGEVGSTKVRVSFIPTAGGRRKKKKKKKRDKKRVTKREKKKEKKNQGMLGHPLYHHK